MVPIMKQFLSFKKQIDIRIRAALFFISCILFAGTAPAQEITYEQLEYMYAAINAQLPQPMGNGMEFTSVAISKEGIVQRYTVNDIGNTISKNKVSNESKIKEQIKAIISGTISSEEEKVLYHSISKLGLKLIIQMISANNGEVLEITFSPEEVEEIASQSGYTPMEMVYYWVTNLKTQIPVSMGAGIIMQDVILDEKMLQYIFSIDEDILSFDAMDANRENIKNSVRNSLFSGNDLMSMFQTQQMALAGLSLSYKYVGSQSKKSFSIEYTNQEMKELLQLDLSEKQDSISVFDVDSVIVE